MRLRKPEQRSNDLSVHEWELVKERGREKVKERNDTSMASSTP